MSSAATMDTFMYPQDVIDREEKHFFSSFPRSKDFSAYGHEIDYQSPSKTDSDNILLNSISIELRHSLVSQLNNLMLIGDSWSEDGVKGPNEFAISFSRALIEQFVDSEIEPLRITQSAEEGICFIFQKSTKFLYLEIYNDEELGILVEDYAKKKILKNLEVESEYQILQEISSFIEKE